jgi:hypothetical protein
LVNGQGETLGLDEIPWYEKGGKGWRKQVGKGLAVSDDAKKGRRKNEC